MRKANLYKSVCIFIDYIHLLTSPKIYIIIKIFFDERGVDFDVALYLS